VNDAITSLGNARKRGLYLLLVVAVTAGAAGGAIDRIWVARQGGLVGRQPDQGRLAAKPGDNAIPSALRALDLTDEQRGRILSLAEKYRPAAESLAQSVAPRVQQLDLQLREEAMCVLTPAQRDTWIAQRKREGLGTDEPGQMLRLVSAGQCPKDAAQK